VKDRPARWLLVALLLAALLTLVGGASQLHSPSAAATTTSCPVETVSCVSVPFPCSSCSVVAGPVTDLVGTQATYVRFTGFPVGDLVAVAFCPISSTTEPIPVPIDPACASRIPQASTCVSQGNGTSCPPVQTPLQWEYTVVASEDFTLPIDVQYDPPNAGGVGISSQSEADEAKSTWESFFCDDSANPCGLLVSSLGSQASQYYNGQGYPPANSFAFSASNSSIVPLSWQSGTSGCGSTSPVQVDAAYSAEQFLPPAVESTCGQPGGEALLPTEFPSVDDAGCVTGTGFSCPIDDVARGVVPVSFTDDPEDPATLAEEKALGGELAYIPIALSATEIAFAGTDDYPVTSYELTPAMTAGIMSTQWNNPVAQFGAPMDDVCSEFPSSVTPCSLHAQEGTAQLTVAGPSGPEVRSFTYYQYDDPDDNFYDLGDYPNDTSFALLNPWPSGTAEAHLGAMFPSTASGATFEVTSWICDAPDVDYQVTPAGTSTPVPVHDILLAPELLVGAEDGPLEYSTNDGVRQANDYVTQQLLFNPAGCETESTLPTDFGSTPDVQANLYDPSSSPSSAAHEMQSAVQNSYSVSHGGVAFTAMDSSQADYYGLLPAALENASGNFVLPDQGSLDAAVAQAKSNPDGTITPNFADTSSSAAGAYPLPMVTYAVVSTKPLLDDPAAAALRSELTLLVKYSAAGGAGYHVPMPSGYVPLPSTLENQALADIAKDIVGNGASGTSRGSSPFLGGLGASGHTSSNTANPTGASSLSTTSTASGAASTSSSLSSRHDKAPRRSPHQILVGPIVLSIGFDRFLLPILLLLAVAGLVVGPLLLGYTHLRRRSSAVAVSGHVKWPFHSRRS
jgi:hypothetical protein